MNTLVSKGSNKYSKIFSVYYEPENPVGIVYFAHGVTEYALRHAELFEALESAGYVVIANDQMGHGRSTSKARTYFTGVGEKTGWECAAEDAFKLINIVKERFPDLPVHGIGFSMGSILIRFMAMKYHYLFRTVTLIGTSYQKKFATFMGKIAAQSQCNKVGETNRSDLIDDLSFEKYNNYFYEDDMDDDGYEYDCDSEDDYSRALWLTSDPEQQKAYVEDEKCTEGFSAGLFFEMLCAMDYTSDERRIDRLRKGCPIMLLSGTDDAAGNFTKGINELEKIYRKCGLRIRKIFYKGARHDILHDVCKDKVIKDIINFLNRN